MISLPGSQAHLRRDTAIQTVEGGILRKDSWKARGFFIGVSRRGGEGFAEGVFLFGQG
jgi:hypothetical protein